MTYIEHAVTIEEIATVTKRKAAEIEAECRELGLYRGRDWAGRPSLVEADAEQLVSGEARRTLEDERAWREHLDRCEAWTADRDEAVRVAQDAATAASAARGQFGPSADSRAREVGVAAGKRFEVSAPPPLWGGVECGNARRLFSEAGDRPGVIDRARDLLAGAPR